VADDVRALSEVLARDPASLVYADLAESLRRRGAMEQALRVAEQGLTRHPEHADGLACLGRIRADRGELDLAREAWTRALAVSPEHLGALKGVGFALYRAGDVHGAAELLARAVAAAPADEGARRALAAVRQEAAAAPAPPATGMPAVLADADGERPPVFRGLEGAAADILLCDDRGRVIAGGLTGADASDVSELAAAELAGVSGEAQRTAQYLGLGAWQTIVAETDHANLVLAPVAAGALLLVRRDRSVPIGLAVRGAERALGAAAAWLEQQGA
jgi:tetratricopeptide (TPR) repeat protein